MDRCFIVEEDGAAHSGEEVHIQRGAKESVCHSLLCVCWREGI